MGITIHTTHKSIDMGAGGFLRLRRDIAKLTNSEISGHYGILLADHYITMVYHGFKEYDRKTEELYEKYRKKYGKVIDFLYAPDTEAKMTYGCAKQLLKVIGDYDNGKVYGYAGRGDHAARFSDFKAVRRMQRKQKRGFGGTKSVITNRQKEKPGVQAGQKPKKGKEKSI